MRRRQLIAANLFTFFDHYDKALFTLCIPFLAPLFLPKGDFLSQLIWAYALLPMTTAARPLGALFFGKIGDGGGFFHGLRLSALGLGASSLAIAFLPTYDEIGIAATGALALLRMIQNLCFAGQTTGSALLALHGCEAKQARLQSSFFQSFGVLGAIGASLGITFMLGLNFSWRTLFAFGGLVAFLPYFVQDYSPPKTMKPKAPSQKNWLRYSSAIIVCGFIYGNYKILTAMLIGLLPLITSLTPTEVMGMNTALLAFDLALIAFFGWLFSSASSIRTMTIASVLLALLGPWIFPAFFGASYMKVFWLRMALIAPSCLLTAPFYAWMKEIAPPGSAYTFIGVAKAIGLIGLGAPAPALFLSIYRSFGLNSLGLAYTLFCLSCTAAALHAHHLVQKPRIV